MIPWSAYWFGWIFAQILQAIALFLWFRKKLGEANNAIATAARTIADKDKIIADRDKIIAETKILELDRERTKLELQAAQFKIQDQLDAENEHYKNAQNAFADTVNEMTLKIDVHADASRNRNAAVKAVTEVIDTFSKYIERAKTYYLAIAKPDLIESLVESEVNSFLSALNEAVSILNSDAILEACRSSRTPLNISPASLGAIDRALLELLPKLDDHTRQRVCSEIGDSAGPLSKLLKSIAISDD